MQRDQERLKKRKNYVIKTVEKETKGGAKTVDQVVREIADQLYLSPNTINKDLYGYRKY